MIAGSEESEAGTDRISSMKGHVSFFDRVQILKKKHGFRSAEKFLNAAMDQYEKTHGGNGNGGQRGSS